MAVFGNSDFDDVGNDDVGNDEVGNEAALIPAALIPFVVLLLVQVNGAVNGTEGVVEAVVWLVVVWLCSVAGAGVAFFENGGGGNLRDLAPPFVLIVVDSLALGFEKGGGFIVGVKTRL